MSAPQNPAPELTDRLNGWKEIAGHLGKSVSSVQRWERDLGLPVRRIKTTDGQIVSASRKEVDAWREHLEGPGRQAFDKVAVEAPISSPPTANLTRRYLMSTVAALGIAAVALGSMWALGAYPFASPARPIESMVLIGRNLEARDNTGAVLWTHSFGTEVARPLEERLRVGPRDDRLVEADLDGDGSVEHVVGVHFGAPEGVATTDRLYAFSGDGQPLWTVEPDETFECSGQRIGGPWILKAAQVSSNPGPKRLWMAYVHNRLGLSFVTEVSADGHARLRYLQAGWITSLAEWTTPTGVRLMAGGVLHDADRPSVVMLDPDGPAASSPDAGPRYRCEGAPTARPLQVTLLPNFELAAAIGHPYLMIHRLKIVGSELQAEIGSDALATMGADGVVTSLMFSDIYWARHRQFETERKLPHSALACPEATTQGIRSWTAQGGWQPYLIPQARLFNPAR